MDDLHTEIEKRKGKNDKEYKRLLERLVKGAEYLENPMLNPEDREKGMALYNDIDKKIEEIQKQNPVEVYP